MISPLRMALAFVLLIACVPLRSHAFVWETATPDAQGMSAQKLDAMRAELAKRNTKAFLVIRNDKIVYEWYSPDHSAKTKHFSASMAKAAVGGVSLAVAISDGRIHIDDLASNYIPQWQNDPLKSKITIRQLGSHTSGLEDAEADNVAHDKLTGWKGDFWKHSKSPNDPFTLSREVAPVIFPPGEKWAYSNPGIGMLGYAITAALRDAPQKDLRTLLRERVMRPIGVPDDEWNVGYGATVTVDGLPLVATWGGGNFTARAAASLGRLMLREGDWDGQRLINADAVRQCTAHAGLPGHNGIGWWTNARGMYSKLPRDAYWGSGAQDQFLLVVPSLQLICIRNGGALASKDGTEDDYVTQRDKLFFSALAETVVASTPAQERGPLARESARPYSPSRIIERIEFDFATHQRLAIGSDNWPVTWADDGHQYAAWGDGGGFAGSNSKGRVTLGVARIEGDATNYVGKNVWGGFAPEHPKQFEGKSYGILSVAGTLYMWVAHQPGPHLETCQLASSTDHGATWKLADWQFHFADQLTIPTLLNFGRDYQGARDGYVYSYYIHPTWGPARSTVGNFAFDVHKPGRIYLSRVPKESILDRSKYEFFAGLSRDGLPKWTAALSDRRPVFEDANGVGWCLNVSYNPGLKRYLLTTEHAATHVGKMGIFDAPEPWGPWTTVAYEEDWGKGHFEVSSFYWNFAPKWLSANGENFTLVFTGKNSNDSWNTISGRFIRPNRK